MGTCYSRKVSTESHYYPSLPMESVKSGIPPRSIRPSPYSRNVTESFGFGPNKRPLSGSKLPQSTKSNSALERSDGSIENLPISSNTSKSRPSKLQALGSSSVRCVGRNKISPTSASTGIPQRFKECNKSLSPTNANVLEPNLDAINSNLLKCDMKQSIITNDNLESTFTYNSKFDNIQSKDKEQVSEKSEQLTIKPISDKICSNSNTQNNYYKVEDNLNTSIDKEVEMKNLIKKSGLPTRISHKPSKLTSFISGLRKPQDQQDKEKLHVPLEKSQIEIPNHSIAKKEKHNDGLCVVTDSDERLYRVGDYKIERNQRFSSLSNSQLVDRDSGVGSAFSECGRLEDSDTLKDAERFSSFEGSPVSRKSREPSVSSDKIKLQDSSEDIQNGYSVPSRIPSSARQNKSQGNTLNFKYERKEEQLQQLNLTNKNDFSQTYGSVRGILTYRKIPPMKYSDETSKAAWKKAYDTKIQNTKRLQISSGYSNIPKTKYTIPKLDKGISKRIQVKDFTVTSEGKDSDDTQLAQVSRITKCSSPFQASATEDDHINTGSQVSQDTTDSTFEDQGCFSPTCDSDNRDFLIDDEIEDQPGLMAFENEKDFSGGLTSLQQSVTELTELQAANQSRCRDSSTFYFGDSLKSCSDIGSSCSSLASDDLILVEEGDEKLVSESTVVRRHHKRNVQSIEVDSSPINESSLKQQLGWRLRSISQPPPVSSHLPSSESDEGSIKLEAPTYKLICQDVNSLKTNLLHLKNMLHEAETLNPFEVSTSENVFYLNLVNNDLPSEYLLRNEDDKHSPEAQCSWDINSVSQENVDLRRLVILLQEQLEERDYLIRSLQQQLVRSWMSNQNETGTCEDAAHPSSLVSFRKKLSPHDVRRSRDDQNRKEKKKSTGADKSRSAKPILPSS
ncbi:uncharacterized protein LOC106463526 isoform X2 [Limulus polyphemus]|uniref:Uncharacterized protein LOC106463526 isoform X2 n=1 Tax=Limulus polyphemus TaxID=6850 RepID=A0ABM1ST02_LIMPO|nr:uncharacterized protein LOC106463526 isoform X2 [Limulus polyphemus]